MPDLKLNELRDKDAQPAAGQAGQPAAGQAGQPAAGQAGQPAPGQAGQPAPGQAGQNGAAGPPGVKAESAADTVRRPTAARTARRVAATVTPKSLWRSHRLFSVLVLLSILPRILAAAAFRPALLTADSFLYMQGAVRGDLGTIRPSGYSAFLYLFQGLPHALLLVTTAQHIMGIGVAVIVYGLLRYWGLPGWGACLAAAPTLFDTRQVALESYILPDTLFCLVIVLAVALLLTRRVPRLWQCAVCALLLSYAAILRGNGIPLVVAIAAFMLIRKVGWKALVASVVVFAVPVLGYVYEFHQQHGQYNIASSDGIFLWSRTTSFANCAIIKPPPDLAPLCPNKETSVAVPAKAPAWSVPYLLSEPTPARYLWASDVWWRHDAHPGINAYNDKLGTKFALDAIKAQPLDYLKVGARDVMLVFLASDRPQSQAAMTFNARPRISVLPAYYVNDLHQFAGTSTNTHAVYPYAFFLFLYQQPVYFSGVIFLLVLIAGLIGVLRNWRRWGGMQALPWAMAAISIVSPALVTQSLYRYAMVAIPLACLAAGLSFARQAATAEPAAGSGTPGQAATAEPAAPSGTPSQAATAESAAPSGTPSQAATAEPAAPSGTPSQAATAEPAARSGTPGQAAAAEETATAGPAGGDPAAGRPADAGEPAEPAGAGGASGTD